MAAPLRPATARFLAEVLPDVRRRQGQYFTPAAIRTRLLDLVELTPNMRVLDPGAGTGEFLLDVLLREPSAAVAGFEIDAALAKIAREAHGLLGVVHSDALSVSLQSTYDLVIGNPPYFEVRGRPELRARFASVISGRPNIFSMFIHLGLSALGPSGVLAFVVPPSMNNGAYFEALRRHILDVSAIERLVVLDDATLFEGAQQSVQLLVLRKGPTSDRHVFRAKLGRGDPTPLFLEHPESLQRLLRGQRTLADLGFRVQTGRCVWNQRRADLRARKGVGTARLVWARDIGDAIEISPPSRDAGRPSYVLDPAPDVGPAIVVNRVTGAVGCGSIRAALVPAGQPFVAENHVNVVRANSGTSADETLYRLIVAGLRSERATSAVRALTGNTQLSATELGHLIPVSVA